MTFETIAYAYDRLGGISITDVDNNTTSLHFDHRGSLAKVVNPTGDTTSYSYDDVGQLVEFVDAQGNTTSYGYDRNGNLTSIADPLGKTQIELDDAGRLRSLTDANGNTTAFTRNPHGSVTTTTYADGSTQETAYDTNGLVIREINGRGQAIDYEYDAAGRLLRKDFEDGSADVYTYDDRGNMLTATNDWGTITFNYDDNDFVTRVDYPEGRFLTYTYDSAGRRTSMTDQLGNETRYAFDPQGRLWTLHDEANELIVQYGYDTLGRLQRADNGNGTYTTYAYDANENVDLLINYAPDDSILSSFDYTYDENGRRTAVMTVDGAWMYNYDATGQLVRAEFDSTNAEISDQEFVYEYDALGNRVRTMTNGVETVYVTNDLNQYVTIGDVRYEYDADGNLTSTKSDDDTEMFQYGVEGALLGVQNSSNTSQYVYDALGNRVGINIDDEIVEFQLDLVGTSDLVATYDSSGILTTKYYLGRGLVSFADHSDPTGYFAFDALGSVVAIVGSDGKTQINKYVYDSFGAALLSAEAIDNAFQYVGQIGVTSEPNNLHFMRARFYDGSDGRFMSRDPIGFNANDANLYRYVGNRPTSLVDPSGLGACSIGVNVANLATCIPLGIGNPWIGGICGVVFAVIGELCDLEPPPPRPAPSTRPQIPSPDDTPPWEPPPTTPAPPTPPNSPTEPRKSQDPNQKLGPGLGESGFITGHESLSYRIDFENDADASAPAQVVRIVDQLDSKFDWQTFALSEVGFGDEVVSIPRDSQHFETILPVDIDGSEFEVEITAGLDPESGEFEAWFVSLDPSSGLPPDVLTGFLPPEDGTGRGQGFITYTIQATPDLVTGTEIRNVAQIQFDFAEIITTNQVDPHDPSQGTDPNLEALVTIDADPPTSNIEPMTPVYDSSAVELYWTATDGVGSGVERVEFYASEEGGPFEKIGELLTNTDAEAFVFMGQHNTSYEFYSVAIDQLGQRELAPSEFDAATTVVIPPPRVTAVRVGGGNAWSETFLDQVDPELLLGYPIPTGSEAQWRPLPWSNLTEIAITFSNDVDVDANHLNLFGVNHLDYRDRLEPAGFVYDSSNQTATWTLAEPLGADKLLLTLSDDVLDQNGSQLDGEWTDGESENSGDGFAGGIFQFRFNLLPGDVNQSSAVAVNDVGPLRRGLGRDAEHVDYSIFADLNGSGMIAVDDVSPLRVTLGTSLPIVEPTIPSVAALPFLSADNVDSVMRDDDTEFDSTKEFTKALHDGFAKAFGFDEELNQLSAFVA